MAKSHKILVATLLLIFTSSAIAQNGINSPYSRYGFGMLSDKSMGFNQGMGGVAMGFRDGQSINAANPASYSAVDSLTALFDFGLSLQNGNYKMGNLQQNAKNSSFDYAAFQFRATKGVGIAVGILPYSNINYSLSSSSEVLDGTESTTSSYSFSGDGGLRQIFIGAGWQIFKPLSIGVNASYLYGEYTHSIALSFSESSIFSLARTYTAEIKTYMLDFGLQYTQPINKNDKITAGFTYSLGHDINNSAYRTTGLTTSSSTESQSTDTIRNAFQLPHAFAAGLTYYHGEKLRIGADFELQKWSNVKFPSQDIYSTSAYTSSKNQLYDRMKISLGGSYVPDVNSRNYLKRISYKIGGYYSKSYANTDNTGVLTEKPYEFGLTAGVSLPITNRNLWYNSPKIHITFEWIHSNIPYLNSTTNIAEKLTENYLKLRIGLTFSERWFHKWKVQ